jgi:hypothetical protein
MQDVHLSRPHLGPQFYSPMLSVFISNISQLIPNYFVVFPPFRSPSPACSLDINRRRMPSPDTFCLPNACLLESSGCSCNQPGHKRLPGGVLLQCPFIRTPGLPSSIFRLYMAIYSCRRKSCKRSTPRTDHPLEGELLGSTIMSPPRWTAREWCHPALHTLDIIYSSVLAQSTLQATLHKAWIAPAECAIWSSSPVQLLPGIYLWQADYLPISPPRPCNVHTIFLLRQVLSRGVNNTGPYKYSFLGIFSNAIYFLSSRPSCPLLVFFFHLDLGPICVFIFQFGLVGYFTNLRISVAEKETSWKHSQYFPR